MADRFWSLLAVSSLLVGCERPESLRAVHRLADPFMRTASTSSFGTDWKPESADAVDKTQDPKFHVAGIGNDFRYVLANPPSSWLPGTPDLTIPGDGKVKIVPLVPKALLGAKDIAAQPRLMVDQEWVDLDPVVVHPVDAYKGIWLPIQFSVPERYRGKPAILSVQLYGLRWGRETRIESPELLVPKDAVLELAVGVANPLKRATSALFKIEACADDKCEPIGEERVRTGGPKEETGWRDLRVDLRKLADRKVRLVFRTEVEAQVPVAEVFPLWAHPTVYAKSETLPEQKATNVILVSLDTLSARHLDAYGYREKTAPHMTEAFGKGGTIFDNCVAAGTATVPSHMTMFTGVHPLEHNMTDGATPVSRGAVPVAAVARDNGVETAAFTEDGWLSVGLGYGRGFDRFVENRSPNVMAPEGHVARTFGAAKQWIAANKDKSFFLFVHTFQVHDPYVPPESYRGLFLSGDVDREAGTAPEQVKNRIAYDEEIRYVDDEVSKLLGRLDELGLSESTAVIVTGDHGEQFGEHGYVLHGNYPHEEIVHVPLFMRGPGIPAGVRVPNVVGHVDFLPTILDLLGIPSTIPGLRGRSLLKFGSLGDRPMYTESWGQYALTSAHEVEPFLPPAIAVRKKNLKLVRYRTDAGYRYEGHDLSRDLHERMDLFRSEPSRFDELRGLLDAYENETAAGRERLQSGDDSPAAAVKLDPEQEQKLKALGYLQ